MISTVKPYNGSGSGFTDYAYQLIKHIKPLLSKNDSIDELYAIKEVKKNNIAGLIKTNTIFKRKIALIPSDRYDIIHITDQEIGFVAKMLKGAHNSAKIITTVHDLTRFEKGLHRGIMQNAYNKLVRDSTVAAIRYSDTVLCNSSQTYKTMKEKFPALENLILVPNGIDNKFFKTAKLRKHNKNEKFIIGYIGALAYHKNVIFILETAEMLKNDSSYRFEIYGKGPELTELTRFKKRHRLSNVEFMGYAPERDKIKVYDGFDVFIFPSLYEGLGLPILEAQARGLPVIIYKNSNLPKEVTKLCINANSPIEAAHAIHLAVEIGQNVGVRKAEIRHAKGFIWSKTAKKTLEMYKG